MTELRLVSGYMYFFSVYCYWLTTALLTQVNPQCDHNSKEAHALAVGAYEVLENAKVFSTVEESIADLQMIYATSGRSTDIVFYS